MSLHANPPSLAIQVLNLHIEQFIAAVPHAKATDHPVPTDTRAWSQILVSYLVGIKGIARKKGSDLADGSDVKAANVWEAIDTPRFNGVIPSGRKGSTGTISSLDKVPYLFLVMWDIEPKNQLRRCRVWVVRPGVDPVFRKMCSDWYAKQKQGAISSSNFQLHPPRNKDSNTIRNECGNLDYPLLLEAVWNGKTYVPMVFDPGVLTAGVCTLAP